MEEDTFSIMFQALQNKFEELMNENIALRKQICELQSATFAPEDSSACLSYVNKQGVLKLPMFVINELDLKNGGGVVFWGNDGVIEMRSDSQAQKYLGWDEDE